MSKALEAGFWGLVAGLALVIGAAAGFYARVPPRLTAAVMGFGGGVLISALAFDLMDDAYRRGGFDSTSAGFLGGAVLYTAATWALNHGKGRHRKRSNGQLPSEEAVPGSGTAIVVGSLIDGIPESIAIGVSIIAGGTVSVAAVVAIFLSNIPEGLCAAVGMRKAGRSARYVLGLHAGIAALSAAAALLGYTVFSRFSGEVIAATVAVAAGGILAMLADTMMPEAFEEGHNLVGLVTVVGFLAAFVLTKLEH